MKSIKINSIIKDLEKLSHQRDVNDYAIRQNICFFQSLKSLGSYIWWLVTKAPHIDSTRLLELNDFPFPEYDRAMHVKLIEMERKNFPGLIKPIVDKLFHWICNHNSPIIVCNTGSGAMEVERQVIVKLMDKRSVQGVVFIGIDRSKQAHNLARENLKELSGRIRIIETDVLDDDIISRLKQEAESGHQYTVVLCTSDVFDLHVKKESFDVTFNTLFKHHLTRKESDALDIIIKLVSKNYFEYDGYRSWVAMIPQTIIGWDYPEFLNAEIFSNLRFMKKKEVRSRHHGKGKLKFYPIGYYMLEYES